MVATRAGSRWAWIGLMILLVTAGSTAQAQSTGAVAGELVQSGTLTIATSGKAPPYSFPGRAGLQGYDIDVCSKFAQTLGLTPQFVQLDFAGTLPGLIAGRWDMVCSGVNRTEARLASTDLYLSIPYAQSFATVIVRANSDLQKLEDCKGRKVGGTRGGAEDKLIADALGQDFVPYPGFSEALLDLKNGRVDCVSTDFMNGGYVSNQDPSIRVISKGLKPGTRGVAIRRAEPELRKAVNKMIRAWIGDGSLLVLQKKWFGVDALPDPSQMPADD